MSTLSFRDAYRKPASDNDGTLLDERSISTEEIMADTSLDQSTPRSRAGISPAEEKRLARELSPEVAWPTILLAILLPGSFISLVVAGLTGTLPLWICTPILCLVSYAHYTLVHESVHGNIVSKRRDLNWIHTLIGWIGSIGIGGGWPVLQKTHLLHHSHTNTERDPDIIVKGSLAQLLLKWVNGLWKSLIPFYAMRYIAPDGYAKLQSIFTRAEILQTSAVTVVALAFLALAAVTGHVVEWVCLWFIPTRVGVLLLNIFFQWMPHYPFDRTDRYRNTRISLWMGGTIFTLGQNLHLIHHLWPSVPFYNYPRLYRALRPVLIEEGSPIQGLAVRGTIETSANGDDDRERKKAA